MLEIQGRCMRSGNSQARKIERATPERKLERLRHRAEKENRAIFALGLHEPRLDQIRTRNASWKRRVSEPAYPDQRHAIRQNQAGGGIRVAKSAITSQTKHVIDIGRHHDVPVAGTREYNNPINRIAESQPVDLKPCNARAAHRSLPAF